MIKLVGDTIDNQDIDALADWLKTYPRLTQGVLTKEYEAEWSSYLGVKYSISVNSGSSANLLMLYTLMQAGDLKVGDGVIVPALSWSTDLAPIMQLGLKPILCDCNVHNFSLDKSHLKKLLAQFKPKAVILVPVLGFVPDMREIISECKSYDAILLEDCCEALGSEYKQRKLGTFGVMSTFSTFFGHHISTIEGGMICTDNPKYNKILRALRSHGWDRDMDSEDQKELRETWEISEFDSKFTFYYPGFNVRSTDFQAFLGLRQLKKLDYIIKCRYRNYLKYVFLFKDRTLLDPKEKYISNFAYPLITPLRDIIFKALKEAEIECRPLVCGSLGEQPMYIKEYGKVELTNASLLKKHGMYLPNHHLLSEEDIETIVKVVNNAQSKD